MPPAAMVLLVPASVRPFDAMNGMSSSFWPSIKNYCAGSEVRGIKLSAVIARTPGRPPEAGVPGDAQSRSPLGTFASAAADVGANGIDQQSRRGEARSLALVDRRDDCHAPLRQEAERRLRLRVGKERRV